MATGSGYAEHKTPPPLVIRYSRIFIGSSMARNRTPNSIIAKCLSWTDFTRAVSELTAQEKGEAFERLTQLYLQTKPEYQTSLKEVWRLGELPLRVRRKLRNLPKSDEGIDLVAETRSRKFWAIQCKYKGDKDAALTVRELSTFTNLAFNSCAGLFTKALVVHSTNKPVRKHKLLGNTAEIGLQRWLELSQDEWHLIQAKLGNKSLRPKKRTPRPHQQKAISAAVQHFLDNKQARGKLLMPCGTGKSLTAFWIAQSLKSKITLVVVPSLSLIKQSVEDWTRELVAQNTSPVPEWLCVCSDQSVGDVSKDEFVESVYDLGLPVTTDPQEIQEFLQRRSTVQRIVFVTYQSSPVFAKAARSAKAKIDLAILDEAHKTAGEKGKTYSTLLLDNNLGIQRRLFMTATERIQKSGSSDEVVSMDDAGIYGKCFYHLSFKEAIHAKPSIISDYKILTVFVTDREIKLAIQEQSFVSDAGFGIEAVDARQVAAAIALRRAYKENGIKHAVSFHRSILSASDFANLQERLNGLKSLRPRIECFHISSKKSAGERTELLTDFASSERSLITNAKCLTEGVDVPAIDCVLFSDPKQSTIDIVQAAGRALRPFSGKKYGYIMLPIIVPDGISFVEFAESTDFRAVSKVITSLSTQDERIAEEFRISDKAKSRRAAIIEFTGNLPVGIKIDLNDFAEAVSAKVWERVAKVNWRNFEEARAFAHSRNFDSRKGWRDLVKSNKLPRDIPREPNEVYKGKGWIGWGDWLGSGNVSPSLREFLPFEEAREFTHRLNIKSQHEWNIFRKSSNRPSEIPANPPQTYKDKGWISWGDWLGTDRVANQNKYFLQFKKAREFARSLKIRSSNDWKNLAKSNRLPNDIPKDPFNTYQHTGWRGWGDWLGTGYVANQNRQYRPFIEARAYARALKLKSGSEWVEFAKTQKLPDDIPTNVDNVYKNNGWIGWGDWLGTGNIAPINKKFRSFEHARAYVHNLNLKSGAEWRTFANSENCPKDIPANPARTYKDEGWKGMGDWLGTGNIAVFLRQFRNFEEARAFVHKQGLKSGTEWKVYAASKKRPRDIPSNPARIYKDEGWKGMGDWLGTGRVANQNNEYLPFGKARDFVHRLNLKSYNDWRNFKTSNELPGYIPKDPYKIYMNEGWISWGDWLGTGSIANFNKNFRPFGLARDVAQALKLKSQKDWFIYVKSKTLPDDIPADPARTYKEKGWISWGDWLGTGREAPKNKQFRIFKEARKYVHTLNLKSRVSWRNSLKSGTLPSDIPSDPAKTYKEKGWISWGDWLGTGTIAPFLRQYLSYEEARAFVHKLNLKSGAEWRNYNKSGDLPDNIPKAPQIAYKDKGWRGMGDWLGK